LKPVISLSGKTTGAPSLKKKTSEVLIFLRPPTSFYTPKKIIRVEEKRLPNYNISVKKKSLN